METEEIICLCPYCKKHIKMRFKVRRLNIDIKEMKAEYLMKSSDREVNNQ